MSEPTISLPGFSDTEQCDENEDNFRSDVDSTQLKGPLTTSKEYFLTGKKMKLCKKVYTLKVLFQTPSWVVKLCYCMIRNWLYVQVNEVFFERKFTG